MPLQSFVWSKSKNPKQQVLKPGHHEYYHSSKNLFRNTSPQHVHGKESRGCFSELQNFKITDFIVNVCLLCLLIYLFCGERSVRFVKTSELWTSQNNSSKTFFCLNMLSYLKPKHFAEKYQFHWPWDESVLQAVLYFTEIVGFILLHLGCNSLPPQLWKSPPDTILLTFIGTYHRATSFQCLAPSERGRAMWVPALQKANDASTWDAWRASFQISLPPEEGGMVLS